MTDLLTIYGTPGAWRWRLRAAGNGRVIGASTEAYQRRARAYDNAVRVVGDLVPVAGRDDVYEVRR